MSERDKMDWAVMCGIRGLFKRLFKMFSNCVLKIFAFDSNTTTFLRSSRCAFFFLDDDRVMAILEMI
jgi:hypothetical protein